MFLPQRGRMSAQLKGEGESSFSSFLVSHFLRLLALSARSELPALFRSRLLDFAPVYDIE